jgi:septin family protein
MSSLLTLLFAIFSTTTSFLIKTASRSPLLPTERHLSGESGLGKSTLINTLFATELVTPKNYRHRFAKQLDKTTEVEIIKAELQERDFSVKLTVIDTPGFGDYVNNRERSV